MTDLLGLIAALRRPRLLVSAARFGVEEYGRTAHLPRLLRTPSAPGPSEAIRRLLEVEADLERRRAARSADYAVGRHVAVLAALMGEARLLRASRQPEPVALRLAA